MYLQRGALSYSPAHALLWIEAHTKTLSCKQAERTCMYAMCAYVVTHPTLLLSRGARRAVGVLVPLRHWPNKRADWLKNRTINFSKAKCAKDPENEIIKQKTSADRLWWLIHFV